MTQYKWLPEQPTEEMMLTETELSYSRWSKYDIYRSMWKSAPEVEQEPVGYVYTHRLKELNGTDKDCRFFKYEGNEISDYYTKLYTHPQPNREPLKKEDIMHLLEKRDEGSIIDFIRLIEKAHGIGG
jgi:hypothetical protein